MSEAKKFDPADVVATAGDLQTINDPTLGIVSYGRLTKKEFETIQAGAGTQEAKLNQMIYMMLKKAYPTLQTTDIDNFPIDVVYRLKTVFSARLAPFLAAK